MITVTAKGDFKNTEKLIQKIKELARLSDLDKYGREGVTALSNATPRDSGKTAESWDYQIVHSNGKTSIVWTNSNVNNGVPIAVIIQYGHGTGWGGYVKGIDYINPAMKPVFESIADRVWKEVTGS